MYARACGGRQFHIHFAFLQQYLIISWASGLLVVAVVLPKVGGFELLGRHSSTQGHKAHINEVGAARAAEMGMGETVYDVFVVVVARAGVPSDHLLSFGTQLHHTLRHCGAREGAATEGTRLVGLRADERVDVLGVVIDALGAKKKGQQQDSYQSSNVFHLSVDFMGKSSIS